MGIIGIEIEIGIGIEFPLISSDFDFDTDSDPESHKAKMRIAVKKHPFVLLPVVVYLATVSRDIGLPDSAVVIDAMMGPVISSDASNHNLNNIVGFLFNKCLPGANIALKSNLVSAFYGCIAVNLFYFLLLSLGLTRHMGAACAGVFMLSHSMWWHSTVVENYALSVIFLNACLLLVIKDIRASAQDSRSLKYFYPLLFLAGISLFNHIQNIVLSLACGVYVVSGRARFRGRNWKVILSSAAAYCCGTLPYVAVVLKDALDGRLSDALFSAAGGQFIGFMFDYDLPAAFRRLADLTLLQFPSPFLGFILIGVPATLVIRRVPEALPTVPVRFSMFLWTVFLANTAFFMGYATWDQFSFYLLSFACLAVVGSVGAAVAYKWCSVFAALRRDKSVFGVRCSDTSDEFGAGASFYGSVAGRPLSVACSLLLPASLALSILLPPFIYANIRHWAKDREYWRRQYRDIQLQYEARYDMVGLLTDPIRRDRGSLEGFIKLLFGRLPQNSLLIDDMSTYYQIGHFQKRYGMRNDVSARLIRLERFPRWGETIENIARGILDAPGRVFMITDSGRCGELAGILSDYGFVLKEFPLDANRHVYELTRTRK